MAFEVGVQFTSSFVLSFHCLLVYESHATTFVNSKYSLKLTKNGIPFVTWTSIQDILVNFTLKKTFFYSLAFYSDWNVLSIILHILNLTNRQIIHFSGYSIRWLMKSDNMFNNWYSLLNETRLAFESLWVIRKIVVNVIF